MTPSTTTTTARLATFRAAVADRDAGRYDEAVARLTAYLHANPDDGGLLALLSHVYRLQGRGEAASQAVARAATLEPDSPLVLFNLARQRLAEGQAGQALDAVQRGIAIEPRHPEGPVLLAACLDAAGQSNEAAALLDRVLSANPSQAEAWGQRALIRARRGDLVGAMADARQALAIKPHLRLWAAVARWALALKREDEAAAAYARAIAQDPPEAISHRPALADLLRRLGRLADARACLLGCLVRDPAHAAAWAELGAVEHLDGRTEAARRALGRALLCDPRQTAAATTLGVMATTAEDLDEALIWFARAAEWSPTAVPVLMNHGKALVALERYEEAATVYGRVLALVPNHADATMELASLPGARPDGAQCRIMEDDLAANAAVLSPRKRAHLHFTLGKAYLGQDAADRAFAHFAAGQAARLDMLGLTPVDVGFEMARLRGVTALTTADFFDRRRGWGLHSRRPIFIVGMPRSGTSLVEQILASHSRVFGAGELPDIGAAAVALLGGDATEDPAEADAKITRNRVEALARAYLERLDRLASGHPFVTDKMPHNFERLWLIALMVPQARILHVRRDPMDTCLSIYACNLDSGHPYAANLRTLGVAYRIYETLMDHWRNVLPLPIYDVVYEDLVMDPEAGIGRLLDLCDLPFEPACLRFYETDRLVRTASSGQVKRPMSRKSIGRAQRFERQLAPLREVLETRS